MGGSVENVKDNQRPGMPPGAQPEITPEMVQSVLKMLESKGLVYYTEGGAYVPTDRGWKLLREGVSGKEIITARGHEKITARDENCFEITTNKTPGMEDSVICVSADKGCRILDENFKNALKTASKLTITVEADDVVENISAFGSPALKLTDANEIIVRKSDFIDGKTAAILADKSANDFSNELKSKLKNPKTKVRITLEIK
jgi:hypothetical protein